MSYLLDRFGGPETMAFGESPARMVPNAKRTALFCVMAGMPLIMVAFRPFFTLWWAPWAVLAAMGLYAWRVQHIWRRYAVPWRVPSVSKAGQVAGWTIGGASAVGTIGILTAVLRVPASNSFEVVTEIGGIVVMMCFTIGFVYEMKRYVRRVESYWEGDGSQVPAGDG